MHAYMLMIIHLSIQSRDNLKHHPQPHPPSPFSQPYSVSQLPNCLAFSICSRGQPLGPVFPPQINYLPLTFMRDNSHQLMGVYPALTLMGINKLINGSSSPINVNGRFARENRPLRTSGTGIFTARGTCCHPTNSVEAPTEARGTITCCPSEF